MLGLDLKHNRYYYVTVESVNKVNQRVRVFSEAILIDDTHPVEGMVVELSSEYHINGTIGFSAWDTVDCINAEGRVGYDTVIRDNHASCT